MNAVLKEINEAVKRINFVLTSAKEKIAQKEKNGYHDLWNLLYLCTKELKECSNVAIYSGLAIILETILPHWNQVFAKSQKMLVDTLVSQANSFRILIQVIERYTLKNLIHLTRLLLIVSLWILRMKKLRNTKKFISKH